MMRNGLMMRTTGRTGRLRAALALALAGAVLSGCGGGSSLGATSDTSSGSSISSRFSQLFGSKSQAVGEAAPPPVDNRTELSARHHPRRGVDLCGGRRRARRRSATICAIRPRSRAPRAIAPRHGDQITARIGIQGRVIVGPAGAPPTVEIPLRVAVVQGGVQEKTIATKVYRTTVTMNDADSVPFSLVAEDVVYPVPPGATGDSYIFYIGFDPQALTPEPPCESRSGRRSRAHKKTGAMVSRRLVVDTQGSSSVQLGANFRNALGQQVVGDPALDRLRQDGGSRRNRGIGSRRADVGQRLGFGQRDLALGGLGAPGDEIFHLGLGLGRDALGFGSRRRR